MLSSTPPQLGGLYARSHQLAVAGSVVAVTAYAGVTAMWLAADLGGGTGLGAAFATIPVALLGPPVALAAGLLTLPAAFAMHQAGVTVIPGFGVASVAASVVGGGLLLKGWFLSEDPYLATGAAVLGLAPVLSLLQCFQTYRRGQMASEHGQNASWGLLPVEGGAVASLSFRF
jgi:hypothetical protein